MTLTEFLLARIAEDEAAAEGAIRWNEGCQDWADAGEPDWQHIARWDPARVLAECEAKRRIVELHDEGHDDGDPRSWEWPYVGCATLRAVALPHTSHSDFDPSWAV